MEFGISRMNTCSDKKCDRCSKDIIGFGFAVDAWENTNSPKTEYDHLFQNLQQYQHSIVCCPECAGKITGTDTEERIRVRSEYDARVEDFLNTPWNPTSNPLVVMKVWNGQLISVMRDKFGRQKFGVLYGKSERWNTREITSRYERSRDTEIRDMKIAETIAFWWAYFVSYYGVKPEDPYTISHFRELASDLSLGIAPPKKTKQMKNWWET